ncbi:MAG: cytochrome c [Candidatus Cyclonatronum sp.]|uniref:c-type cytochrome n=1 Tax=Cyclonatronum sp. TaxID=3024185 RepID=UPI0025BAF4B3|nr:cytochrome c [Cyclonatronum sp.]MCC5935251.1 cytochrome c [Balneolales bacterium]MCH8485821.1 cytochrome c [Cyclonatronum sp.]
MTEDNKKTPEFQDREDNRSMQEIHSAAFRESPLPEEGNERGPIWMYAVIILTFAFGFFYIGRYLGEVSDRAHVLFTAPPTEAVEEIEVDLIAEGQRIYGRVCQACHQANGQGIAGVFPTLAGTEWVVEQPDKSVLMILNGLQGELVRERATYNGVMPPFARQLDDFEIAAVVSYIRNAFGNEGSEIDPDRVARIRELTADISGAYNPQTIVETAARIGAELAE